MAFGGNMAMSTDTDPCCCRAMDPDLALSSSMGLDITMPSGGSTASSHQAVPATLTCLLMSSARPGLWVSTLFLNVWWKQSKLQFLCMCMNFLLVLFLCTTVVPSVCGDWKKALAPLELELQKAMSHHVGAGKQTWVLCKRSQ